ncbi:hypothetical protein Ate02nite_78260 [Paractinoplanes tereljensis]|uniref:Uncharacterized protein n=1 Tax=Paractinoplanes tereljensis TaxID=571912 RepID=A0A919NTS9_9ACTN|nr:hypothetical protein Ate02nite_78260 [Actinoplanes tereljensis]
MVADGLGAADDGDGAAEEGNGAAEVGVVAAASTESFAQAELNSNPERTVAAARTREGVRTNSSCNDVKVLAC